MRLIDRSFVGGKRRRAVTLAALTLLIALLAAAQADAARQVKIDSDAYALRSGGGAIWDAYQTPSKTVCGAGSNATPYYSPVEDGQLVAANSLFVDGFDGGMTIAVGGEDYYAPGARVRVEGEEVRAPSKALAGLRVSRVDTALRSGPTLRSLVKLTNPGGSSVSATVALASDLGTDGQGVGPRAETVHATSSGDTTFAPADRWLVSGEAELTSFRDPAITHVLYGKRAKRKVTTVAKAPGSGSGCLVAELAITVPKRSSRYLLFYAQLNPTPALASKRVAAFNRAGLNRSLLTGIGPKVRKRILNWRLR